MNKIFIINRGDIEGRIDPNYLKSKTKDNLVKHKYNHVELNELLLIPPQYGANEIAIDSENKNDVRYIRITDINEYGLLKHDDFKTANKIDDKYILEKNDLLFARSGATAGKCLIYKEEYGKSIFAGYLIRFKIDENKANSQFIFYLTQLDFYKKWVISIQRPSGQPNINSEEFKKFLIPLPPLEIQNQIVSIMDNAYSEKKAKEAKAKELLDSIDDYVLGELGITMPKVENKMCFTVDSSEIEGRLDPFYYLSSFLEQEKTLKKSKYDITFLSTICEKITDGTHYTPTYVENGVPFLSVKDVRKHSISFDNTKFISYEEHNQLTKRCLPKTGDILLTKVGTIGLSAVIPDNVPEFSIFVSVALLKLKKHNINAEYIAIIMNSKIVEFQFERFLKGIGVPDLHLENIRHTKIVLPTLEIQNKIAEEVKHRMETAKQLQKEAIENLEKAKREVEERIFGE